MSSRVDNRQACNKSLQDEQRKFRDLSVGHNVIVLNFSQGPKWLSGQVMERTGPLSYKTAVGDKDFCRHVDQICKVHLQVHISVDSENINKGSHLQGTCPPTITPLEVWVDLGTQESLVASRPEGTRVPVLNSGPVTEEAPIQGGNQQPTVQATPVASGRPDFVPVVKSYPLVRGNNQCSMVMISVGEVVVFCIVMLMCVY